MGDAILTQLKHMQIDAKISLIDANLNKKGDFEKFLCVAWKYNFKHEIQLVDRFSNFLTLLKNFKKRSKIQTCGGKLCYHGFRFLRSKLNFEILLR